MTEIGIRKTKHAAIALTDNQDLRSPARPAVAGPHLRVLLDAVASGASLCLHRLLAALHDSRRKQAMIQCARYRHLIYDHETGLHFGPGRRSQERSS
jgi:hypothetical protein